MIFLKETSNKTKNNLHLKEKFAIVRIDDAQCNIFIIHKIIVTLIEGRSCKIRTKF
jgi:hypothetical protein